MKIDYKILYFVAILLLYLSLANNYIGANADDSIYIVLGKSLEMGNGYRMISSPDNYISMGHPPILPFIITLIFFLGGNILVIKSLMAILGMFSIYFLYKFLKLFLKEKYAFLLVMLTGISPLFVLYTHQVMSEVLYFLFSILTLYYFILYINKEKISKKYLFFCSIFILLSYFTRVIGFVLILSMFFFVIIEKRDKKNIKRFILIILLIFLPITLWSLRILTNNPEVYEQQSYKDIFLSNDLYNSDLGMLNSEGTIHRIDYNGERQLSQISKTVFHVINWPPLFYPILKDLTTFLILIVLFITIIGFISSLRKRTIIEYYFPIYFIFVLLIPDPSSRFLFPIIPFIIMYFINGIKIIINKLRNKKTILNLIILLVILSSLVGVSKQIYLEHSKNYYFDVWGEKTAGLVDMAIWARGNIPKDENVMVYNAPMFYLLSGIKGTFPPQTFNKTEVLNQIYKKEIEYVVIDKGLGKKYLIPVITEDKFEKIYEKDGNYIYRLKNP